MKYLLCRPSLPVVVITHANQKQKAWVTIIWDNAFDDRTNVSLAVPQQINFSKLSNIIAMRFKKFKLELTELDKKYLANMLIDKSHMDDYDNALISYSQFCVEMLLNKDYTFWQ